MLLVVLSIHAILMGGGTGASTGAGAPCSDTIIMFEHFSNIIYVQPKHQIW